MILDEALYKGILGLSDVRRALVFSLLTSTQQTHRELVERIKTEYPSAAHLFKERTVADILNESLNFQGKVPSGVRKEAIETYDSIGRPITGVAWSQSNRYEEFAKGAAFLLDGSLKYYHKMQEKYRVATHTLLGSLTGPTNINAPYHRAQLMHVLDERKSAQVGDIAEVISIGPSRVLSLCEMLEDHGFIEVEKHPHTNPTTELYLRPTQKQYTIQSQNIATRIYQVLARAEDWMTVKEVKEEIDKERERPVDYSDFCKKVRALRREGYITAVNACTLVHVTLTERGQEFVQEVLDPLQKETYQQTRSLSEVLQRYFPEPQKHIRKSPLFW